MKEQFSWYLSPGKDELDRIWNEGVVTVDANVLLDLYRYNQHTRTKILDLLEQFRGRLWISHQAAKEFFRNRNRVIVQSRAEFGKAKVELEKFATELNNVVERIKVFRVIPAPVVDQAKEKVVESIDWAKASFEGVEKDYPDFLKSDPVLERLLSAFAEVGPEPSPAEDQSLREEAATRQVQKRPPGFLDDKKEGDLAYGDFFIWRQVLDRAAELRRPMIFVTSEKKEDWWERIGGKTLGPRPELLKEAFDEAHQRILIYQTDYFLSLAGERGVIGSDDEAVNEIREVDRIRQEFRVYGGVEVSPGRWDIVAQIVTYLGIPRVIFSSPDELAAIFAEFSSEVGLLRKHSRVDINVGALTGLRGIGLIDEQDALTLSGIHVFKEVAMELGSNKFEA